MITLCAASARRTSVCGNAMLDGGPGGEGTLEGRRDGGVGWGPVRRFLLQRTAGPYIGSFFPVARMSVAGEGRTNLLGGVKPKYRNPATRAGRGSDCHPSFAVGRNDQTPLSEKRNEVFDVRCNAPFRRVRKSSLE
jgi:hypothetical protein